MASNCQGTEVLGRIRDERALFDDAIVQARQISRVGRLRSATLRGAGVSGFETPSAGYQTLTLNSRVSFDSSVTISWCPAHGEAHFLYALGNLESCMHRPTSLVTLAAFLFQLTTR